MADSDSSDTWEKLEADLKRVITYSNSRMCGTPTCAYVDKQDSHFCDGCKFIKGEHCTVSMCSDILNSHPQSEGENHDC